MQYIQQPQAIEAKSFDIISEIIAETRPDYRFASPLQIQPASGNSVMNVVDTRYNPVASH